MAPLTLSPTPGQRARREPLFDVHPQSGATIEVFYADRTMETFGRCGAGWYWWTANAVMRRWIDSWPYLHELLGVSICLGGQFGVSDGTHLI